MLKLSTSKGELIHLTIIKSRRTSKHRVIFLDEKKLDGLEDLAFYCHDMKKEEEIFAKRQQSAGSLMV